MPEIVQALELIAFVVLLALVFFRKGRRPAKASTRATKRPAKKKTPTEPRQKPSALAGHEPAPPDYVPKPTRDVRGASLPGQVTLSRAKLAAVRAWRCRPVAGFSRDELDKIQERLWGGDSQPALVVSLEPFRVAAYSEDLDAVAIVQFPPEARGDREVGARLLSVNVYCQCLPKGVEPDLVPGERQNKRWANVSPLIADFHSDDVAHVEARKSEIAASPWARCEELAETHASREREGAVRCGFYPCSHGPAPRGHFDEQA